MNVLLILYLSVSNISNVYCSKMNLESCAVVVEREYNWESCSVHWNCTVTKLLDTWLTENLVISRDDLSRMNIRNFLHTPLLLRVLKGKLYCVLHPKMREVKKNLTIKAYRALHYINRLNRILKNNPNAIPEATEWWTHQADLVKLPLESDPLPIFGYGGAKGYVDIAGIPYASFSDKLSKREQLAFEQLPRIPWKKRANTAFFRGALSDCWVAKEKFNGNFNFCARAKIIFEANRSKLPILADIATTSSFRKSGLNVDCSSCEKGSLSSSNFVENLLSHKYLLNMPGVGQSRRIKQLMQSGGVVFQSENDGFQFYDVNLKPGLHYITFDPQLGKSGSGNLLSRLYWATENDDIVQNIASRSKSFANTCLTEASIDFFVSTLLQRYSSLLVGNSSKFPLVDLSECLTENYNQSIARLCKGVIQKCWFYS